MKLSKEEIEKITEDTKRKKDKINITLFNLKDINGEPYFSKEWIAKKIKKKINF